MCVIIDNDVRDVFFGTPVDEEMLPLWNWINDRKGVLVVGGRLRKEIFDSENVGRVIREWIRSGRARDLEDDRPGQVDAETDRVAGRCRSNDAHVIALARVSGARLLCSRDSDLHQDFRNPDLIDSPRGHVYQGSSHSKLLTHQGQCPMKAPNAGRGQRGRRK